jgi:16S rRNA (adenine1518-N6/adenine1519-N6)-dimethyltransferase
VPRRPATRGRARALGQHFLRNDAIARRIVDLVHATSRDVALEIGPGRGALTEHLARAAGRVLAIDVDPGLVADLRSRFDGAPHVEIDEADARTFDYATLAELVPAPAGRVLVVGNLPYSVAKPILMALVEAGRAVSEMALMLQKEVADRVAARPGGKTYGSLSVLTQVACDVEFAFAVGPGAFSPPPAVESSVLHLRPRAALPVAVHEIGRFRRVVLAAFGQRRKNLPNALAAGLGMPVDRARAAVEAAGIDQARRAETLTLAEFARLAAIICP